MYLDYTVEIPESKGKITYREKNGATYVYYEYDRVYDTEYSGLDYTACPVIGNRYSGAGNRNYDLCQIHHVL